jgi:predicted chitinase
LDRLVRILARYIAPRAYSGDDKGKIAEAAYTAISLILQACIQQDVTDVGQIAYILATAEHESRFGAYDLRDFPRHNWMEEDPGFSPPKYVTPQQFRVDLADYIRRSKAYFNEKYNGHLGNQGVDDGYKYRGRGYVQLTGRGNYARVGSRLRPPVDLVKNPEKVLQPELAARIIVQGMKEGLYAGPKLSDYIKGEKRDFVGARAIVNGTDRAGDIADIAKIYFKELKNHI